LKLKEDIEKNACFGVIYLWFVCCFLEFGASSGCLRWDLFG
jgi:hypothetical protein